MQGGSFTAGLPPSDVALVSRALTQALRGGSGLVELRYSREVVSQRGDKVLSNQVFRGHVCASYGMTTGVVGFECADDGSPQHVVPALGAGGAASAVPASGTAGSTVESPPPASLHKPSPGAERDGADEYHTLHERVIKFALHELRNSIHAMEASATYFSEIAESIGVHEDVHESVMDMLFAAKNTNLLVSDIISTSRLAEGQLVPAAEDCTVRQLLDEVVSAAQPASCVPIHVACVSSVPTVACFDSRHVRQVLENFLMNAIKHVDSGAGAIYVSVSHDPTHLVFEVLDKGTPFGGVTVAGLLELMKTQGDSIPGRGARIQRLALFLPVTRVLVEDLMFGKVGVQDANGLNRAWFSVKFSEASGPTGAGSPAVAPNPVSIPLLDYVPGSWLAGCGLPVLLPEPGTDLGLDKGKASAKITDARQKVAVPAASGAAMPGVEGQGLGMHVLIADDQKVIRRQAANFCKQLGCTCDLLEDGDQVPAALEAAYRPYDAILLDILMHRSDGATVCRDLRQRHNVRAPIIAMTSQTDPADVQRYYQMGFDVVLSKPFTKHTLSKALQDGRLRRGGQSRFARMSAHLGETSAPTGVARTGKAVAPSLPAVHEDAAAQGGVADASSATAEGPVHPTRPPAHTLPGATNIAT